MSCKKIEADLLVSAGFWVLLAAATSCSGVAIDPASAGGPVLTADDRMDERELEGPGGESPGAAQRGRQFDEPSEDGTGDEPEAARPGDGVPDQTPGCRFRGGPLELVV